MTSERLVCPECLEGHFSVALTQIAFGDMHEFENGHRDFETLDMGEVIDDDIDENGAYCTTCDEFREPDELVKAAFTNHE